MGFFTLYFAICALALSAYLCYRYLSVEQKVRDKAEFLHLLLFPFTGYGCWEYDRMQRAGKAEYPKRWYILCKLAFVNSVLLVVLAVAFLLFFFGNSGLHGTVSGDNDHEAHGFAVFADVYVGIIYGVLFLLTAAGFFGLTLLLVALPKRAAKSIAQKHSETL